MHFKSYDNSQLNVEFHCLSRLDYNTMEIQQDSFNYSKELHQYSLGIDSRDVCNINWKPSLFENKTIPKSRERYSTFAYQSNGTHSIKFDVSSLGILEPRIEILSLLGGKKVGATAIIVPFSETACPYADKCIYSDSSEGFVCYDTVSYNQDGR